MVSHLRQQAAGAPVKDEALIASVPDAHDSASVGAVKVAYQISAQSRQKKPANGRVKVMASRCGSSRRVSCGLILVGGWADSGTDAVDLTLRRNAPGRRSTSVRFGIGAIRKEAQRGLMHPGRDAIGARPDLPITNDGPVKCRLLSPATEVDPCSDAASRWIVLQSAPDVGIIKALPDYFRRRRGQQNRHGASLPPFCASAVPPQGVAITALGGVGLYLKRCLMSPGDGQGVLACGVCLSV